MLDSSLEEDLGEVPESTRLQIVSLRAIFGSGSVAWIPTGCGTSADNASNVFRQVKTSRLAYKWSRRPNSTTECLGTLHLSLSGSTEEDAIIDGTVSATNTNDSATDHLEITLLLSTSEPCAILDCKVQVSCLESPTTTPDTAAVDKALSEYDAASALSGSETTCDPPAIFDVIESIRIALLPRRNKEFAAKQNEAPKSYKTDMAGKCSPPSQAVNDSESLNLLIQKALNDVESHTSIEQPELPVISPTIVSGEPLVEKRSVFQAHCAAVTSKPQVQAVIQKLLENPKIAKATHNISAFRLSLTLTGKRFPKGSVTQGQQRLATANSSARQNSGRFTPVDAIAQECDSDGESAAGGRLLHLLEILGVVNVVVVVSRWYGGVPLGPRRFRCINNVARELLVATGIGNPKVPKQNFGGSTGRTCCSYPLV